MIDYTGTYTDQYELSMALVYFKNNTAKEKAVFDYFFRKLPFGGGYAVFAGLDDFWEEIGQARFVAFEGADGLVDEGYTVGFDVYAEDVEAFLGEHGGDG